MDTYRIVRFFFSHEPRRRVVRQGLTLEQAQEHCNHQETSSSTCISAQAKVRTRKYGPWFDGYEKE